MLDIEMGRGVQLVAMDAVGAMTTDKPIFNFDHKGVRDMAKRMIENARGLWTWELKRLRDQRSLSQNAYYFGVVCHHVAAGIREAWGEKDYDYYRAHEFLRDRFLKRPTVNHNTGEVTGHDVPSTSSLNKVEFAVYLDQIIDFAAKYLRVEIPEADRYRANGVA